jgi:hypothetical protein
MADALKVLDQEGPNREAHPSIQATRMHQQTRDQTSSPRSE